jgi:uncharacterized phage protein (predicted DNA packaging)
LVLGCAVRCGLFVSVNPQAVFIRTIKNKNKSDMKWLTLDWIKKHSRIDFDCEDDLLELYGEAAEDAVLNIINRSYTEVVEHYGEVPKGLYVAALMQVEASYDHRSTVSPQQLYNVPGFSLHVKPYIKLASNNENSNNTGYGKHCNL